MKTITTFLSELDNNDLDLTYNYSEGDTFQEFEEKIQTYISQSEIIYYSVAIAFLSEHDPSLNESMNLAAELCLEVQNINSETLATLLHQDQLREEWYEISEEIQEYFEEWEEFQENNEEE